LDPHGARQPERQEHFQIKVLLFAEWVLSFKIIKLLYKTTVLLSSYFLVSLTDMDDAFDQPRPRIWI